ncbi:beta-propeller fold lactonase family protein [Sedimentitalea sp.]|uniref:YVTN family beta-propeller repeat protein n=1 Tax=Sedimentitalea sp. TaxID=2048915 RepID=UPI003297B4EF
MHWPRVLVAATRRIFSWLLPALVVTSVAAGDFAYVTNQNSDEVSVLDLDAGVELRRVSVPGKPAGIAADGQGQFYTVSPDSKTVRRIDATTDAVLAEAVLEGGPIGIALDMPRGHAFVSVWYNARVWVLDAVTLVELGTLETGSAPAGLAVSPDGRLLACADRDADKVSVFDLATLTLLHRVAVGERPFGLGFAPNGRLFVGNVGSDDVTVLDALTGELLATVPVGSRPYGVAFAAGRAFVTNQYADTVSAIDLATLAPIATIDVGEYPEGIDSTTDQTRVVVANWFSNSVSVIDANNLAVVAEIETGDGPRAFGKFVVKGE